MLPLKQHGAEVVVLVGDLTRITAVDCCFEQRFVARLRPRQITRALLGLCDHCQCPRALRDKARLVVVVECSLGLG